MKIFVTKALQNLPYLFLSNKLFRGKVLSILVPDFLLYYVALHFKLATPVRSSQLVEIFAYENPVQSLNSTTSSPSNATVVYQFHNLFSQERIFLFTTSLGSSPLPVPKSIGELFSVSMWMEREVGEMHGICFENKKDIRNLMLQYGDASAPFRKSYPSIGLKEMFFDSVTDTLVQVPVSTQI